MTELVRLSVPFPPARRAAVNRADGTVLSGSVRFGAIVFVRLVLLVRFSFFLRS